MGVTHTPLQGFFFKQTKQILQANLQPSLTEKPVYIHKELSSSDTKQDTTLYKT